VIEPFERLERADLLVDRDLECQKIILEALTSSVTRLLYVGLLEE
jgi:hypothetical protein